jgi:hypothetical protein
MNITNDTSIRNKIKKLKRAIKAGNENPFLYKGEELRFMKRKLREIVDIMQRYDKEEKNGFGV